MTLPGALFAILWQRVAPLAGDILARPWDGRGALEYGALVQLLEIAPGPEVPKEIEAYLAGDTVPFICKIDSSEERAFVVMCALDEAAIAIHPAFRTRLPGIARPLGGMLAAMRATRTIDGYYADVAGIGFVVPKGHLMPRKRPNDREDASGTDLANQFEHLSLVRPLGDGRTLRFVVPAPSRFAIPPDRADRIGLAPIAEDRHDLAFQATKRGSRAYLDTLPGNPTLSDRANAAVAALLDDGAGLVVLPELTMPHGGAAALSAALKARGSAGTPALVVAGSGVSNDPDPATGRPYNEAVLLSADGRILGRQRKLHLFNMAADRMKQCGIACAPGCDDASHLEDAAAGKELVVYDLHGLGRVLALICEDFQQQTPGGDVALLARPDWIVTPVLDISLTEGRWPHQRAIEIGRKTLSRVVVSCSGTLGVRVAGADTLAEVSPPVNIGICFDGHVENRVQLVQGTGALSPDRVLVVWEASRWPRHKISLTS